jgi:hypothetical protein
MTDDPIEILGSKRGDFDYIYPVDHRLGYTYRWANYPWNDDKIERSRLFKWVLEPMARLILTVLGRLLSGRI